MSRSNRHGTHNDRNHKKGCKHKREAGEKRWLNEPYRGLGLEYEQQIRGRRDER